MLISVIVPAYNAEKWMAGCLDNLLGQSHRELEIIVIDDGSTDRTAEIAAGYAAATAASAASKAGGTRRGAPSVRLLRQENKGLSVSRNRGLSEAVGEYVHFMDVDDAVSGTFYELLAEQVAAHDADIAACEVINEPKPARNTPIVEAQVLITVPEKMRGTQVGRWGYVWRYLFRRSFLEEHGLQFEPGRMIEDLAFSLPAVYFANKVVMTPGAVYTYMLHEGTIMTTRSRAHRRRRHRDLRHARELRHRFARQHGFKIPGVPTSWGFLSLFYVKWFT